MKFYGLALGNHPAIPLNASQMLAFCFHDTPSSRMLTMNSSLAEEFNNLKRMEPRLVQFYTYTQPRLEIHLLLKN
jgi:hypothetical protein